MRKNLTIIMLFAFVALLSSGLQAQTSLLKITANAGFPIASGNDDAEQDNDDGEMDLTSSDLELVDESGTNNQTVGLRFTGLTIPQGTTIRSSYIQFTVDDDNVDACTLAVKAEDVDNSAAFDATGYNISSRTTTSDSVIWIPPAWPTDSIGVAGEDQRTADIGALIQQIVNRPGYVEGNPITIIITGTGEREAESFDGTAPPVLHIEYAAYTGFPIASVNDDAEQDNDDGEMDLTSSDLELVDESGTNNQTVGLRFTGLNIAQGATIVSSYIQFTVDDDNVGACTLAVKAEDVDNSAAFDATGYNISSRTTTSDSVIWIPPAWDTPSIGEAGENQRTPEISALIQQVVDRPGYAQGNPITIIITGTGEREAESFDGTAAPVLYIELASIPPVAMANGPYVAQLGHAINFSSAGSNDPDGNIVSYFWDFGDTQTSTEANPSHTYATADTFDVTLTVTDNEGLTGEDQTTAIIADPGLYIDYPLTSGDDDAEENETTGEMVLGSSDLELVYDSWNDQGNQTVGLRFTGINVPQGTEIRGAYLQFTCDAMSADACTLSIKAEDVDSSAAFTSTDFDISSRTTTSDSVIWIPLAWNEVGESSGAQRSPYINDLIQEIVDRPGWSAGNPITIIITGTGTREAESAPSDEAVLRIRTGRPVNEAPYAQANGPYEGITGGVAVDFSSDGSIDFDGSVVSYLWDFGDTHTSTEANPSHAYADEDIYTVTLTVTDNEGATAVDQATAEIKAPSAYVAFPITDTMDDAEENETSGQMIFDSSDLEMVFDSWNNQGNQTVGLRFTDISVPQGAPVTGAYIQFTVDETKEPGPCALTIVAEAADNSAAFTSTAFDISSRTTTSASVNWSPPDWTSAGDAGPGQQTPNISALIQEVVDRPGYTAGNAITIIITGTGTRTAENMDGAPDAAPVLNIQAIGASSINKSPVAVANGPYSNQLGKDTYFRVAGSEDPDGYIASYLWDFGDGETSTEANVVHTYATAGTFNVTLTVTDNDTLNPEIAVDQTTATIRPRLDFALKPNFPNPFNPVTTIPFTLAKSSEVRLIIYNTIGQKVRTLINKKDFIDGPHAVIWDAKNDNGRIVPSGMYFFRIEAGDFTDIQKAIFVK